MIWLYRIAFLPLFLVVFPLYLRRMLNRGGYGKDFSHRFGKMPAVPAKRKGVPRIWIQAVSVGEIQAIEPILKHFAQTGFAEVVLTTTTSTAYTILREKYLPMILRGGIFPLDFVLFSKRAWNNIQPDLVVLMEGELWPEHLHQAKKRGVPVVLLNGRLSDKSFGRYKKHAWLAKRLFEKLSAVLASSEEDARRFTAVGAKRVEVTGNLKFDVEYNNLLDGEARAALKKELGFGGQSKMLLGSSTWPGEETMLLECFARLREGEEDWRLLIVPRHAERRDEIVKLLRAQALPWVQRSVTAKAQNEAMICLADTTGELRTLTQTADLAFVGKSLPPNKGGQTPIEAAVFGIPMVYGPNMHNFRPICASLERAGAAVRATDAARAQAVLLELAADAKRRKALSESAKAWHQANRGAAHRSIEKIGQLLRLASGS